MDNLAVIQGEYSSFKHIKTRKMVTLEIEVPEERFQEVIAKLGMPIGGESKPVAIALLDKSKVKRNQIGSKTEFSEGERLRTRAVLLCKDDEFKQYVAFAEGRTIALENDARNYIYRLCLIHSRSELSEDGRAQERFNVILRNFDAWKISNQYADNLGRV